MSKNKLLLPDSALVRIVSHSITKETKAVGTLDSLLDHFCSSERSFNHHGQGQKETTKEQRQSIPRETPWIKKNSKEERGMHNSVLGGRVFV